MSATYIDTECGGLLCAKYMEGAELVKTDDTPDAPLVILLSTEAEDSDGDIVHQGKTKHGKGWVLDRFNGAPLVTWQHDTHRPNISGPKTRAKVRKHPTKGRGLHIDPLTFDMLDEFAAGIDGKIRRDVLKEFSAGFMVTAREARKNEDGRVTGFDLYEQVLIEAAVANRGANPETEVLAKRMLGKSGVARTVEAGDSAEVQELKEELADIHKTMEMLTELVKSLGDRVDGPADEARMERTHETLEVKDALAQKAAGEILDTLLRTGNAHTTS